MMTACVATCAGNGMNLDFEPGQKATACLDKMKVGSRVVKRSLLINQLSFWVKQFIQW